MAKRVRATDRSGDVADLRAFSEGNARDVAAEEVRGGVDVIVLCLSAC